MGFNAPLTSVSTSQRRKERIWLHLLLLAATFITTTATGARLAESFAENRPWLLADGILFLVPPLQDPWAMLRGLPYSVTLLTILLAHELGHYFTCMVYGIGASPPYFIPAPTLIGTFGAFIRIRTAVFSKRQLFDVGVAGPLAGIVFIVPTLAIGLAFSKVIPGISEQGDLVFGTPLMLRAIEWAVFPGVSASDIYLHPVARAAWVGLLATALNLMPIGQLDGGHILYAMAGAYHKFLTRIFIVALIPLGIVFSQPSWFLWALVLFLLARRHPRIYDETSLGTGRKRLGVFAFAIFILAFSPAPVHIR